MFKVTDPKNRRHSLPADSHAEQMKIEIPVSSKPKLPLTYQADFSQGHASTSEQSTPPEKDKKQKSHCPLPSIGLTRRFRTDTQTTENIQLKSYTRTASEQPQIALTSSGSRIPTGHPNCKHNQDLRKTVLARHADTDRTQIVRQGDTTRPGRFCVSPDNLPPAHYTTHIQVIPFPRKPKLALTYQANFSKAPAIPPKPTSAASSNQHILLTIPLPKPPLPRHLYPIQEEIEIQLDSYTRRSSTLQVVLSTPGNQPTTILPDVNTSTQSMDLLSLPPSVEQPAITEHEQLYRTLSTSTSYLSESSSTRSGKLLPNASLSIHQREDILAWFWGWARENCRSEKINEEALLKVRQQIQEIHDHKGYHLLGKKRDIWDIRASYKYQQAALDFYAAAGISKQQQRIATLHWAKSGEFYALTQLLLFPIRIMRPLFDMPGFDTTAAKASLNFARGIIHANTAGFLSPAFDVLAAFTKKGKPYPSSIYWQIPSHYGVVKRLGHSIRQVSNLLERCRQQQIAVPDEILDYLEHARHLYKMANAKTYCYNAASAVSSATESLKGMIDASLAMISGGFLYSVSNIITSGASSLIYCLSGPCEELSAMNQIRLQNAKYADILNSNGEIDKNKVMALWHDPHQVDQTYIEQIFCQQTAEYLYKLHRAKRRGQFFEMILTNPYDQAQQINTQKIVYEEEISFLRKQIAVIKPETHKQQGSDIDFLLLLKKNTQDEHLLRLSATAYAEAIYAEYHKYLPEQGKSYAIDKRLDDLLQLKQLVDNPSTDTPNIASGDTDGLLTTWLASLKTLCNGKRLLEGLTYKLECKEKKLAVLNNLQADSISTAFSEEKTASIRHSMAIQHKKYKQYEEQLEKLMNDYYIFNVALNDCRRFTLKDIELGTSRFFPESEKKEKLKDTLAMMSSQSFLAQLLSSRATLMRKSVQVAYKKPGILLTRALERLQIDAVMISAYELGAFRKDLQPQAASLGLSSWAAVTVQEVARTQVNREPYITRYVHNLHRPDIILEQGSAKESINTLMKKRYSTEYRRYPYIPNEDDVREFIQNYTNVRSHPESRHLIRERVKNNIVSSIRLSTDYIKRTLMRYPLMLDLIKGPRANTKAKKLIDEIKKHNLSLKDRLASTPTLFASANQDTLIESAFDTSSANTISDMTASEITNSIRQMGSWNNQAGDLVAQPSIISNVLGRSIQIIHCDMNGVFARMDQTEYNPVQQLPPITLIYNGSDHYDVMLRDEQSKQLQKIPVLADNDCFYRALLSALHNDPNYARDTSSATISQIQNLRNQFADYLDLHQEELEENILYTDLAPQPRNRLATIIEHPEY